MCLAELTRKQEEIKMLRRWNKNLQLHLADYHELNNLLIRAVGLGLLDGPEGDEIIQQLNLINKRYER